MNTFVMVLMVILKSITVIVPFIKGIIKIFDDENGKRLIKNRRGRRGVE